MSISVRTRKYLEIAVTDNKAADEIVTALNADTGESLNGSATAATTPAVVTYTAGSAPYTADGTLTVANGASLTALDAFSLALEVQRQLTAVVAQLHTRGVTL